MFYELEAAAPLELGKSLLSYSRLQTMSIQKVIEFGSAVTT